MHLHFLNRLFSVGDETNGGVLQQIQVYADRFVRRRDHSVVKRIFETHSTKIVDGCRHGHSKDIIEIKNVRAITDDLLIPHNSENDEELFKYLDANCDGEVDYEDIKVVLERPNKVEQWIASIPLGQLIASAFSPIICRDTTEKDPLRIISRCSDQDLSLIYQGITNGFLTLMRTSVDELESSYQKMDAMKAQDGPDSLRTLSCGEVSAFYNGLGDRIGEQEPASRLGIGSFVADPFCRISES